MTAKTQASILHIMPSYQIGGINRYVIDLCSAMKELGTDRQGIFVTNSSINNLAEQSGWKDAVHSVGVRVYEGHVMGMKPDISALRNFLCLEKEYDIIHWRVFVPLLFISAFFDRKKHVFTHHSVLGIGRVSKRTDGIKWALFRFIVNHRFSAQIFNSEFTRNFWKAKKLRTPLERVIYNGIRFSEKNKSSHPAKFMESQGKSFIVGTACAFIACKRLDHLIHAFGKFSSRHEDAHLLLVGDGAERANLETLAAKLGLENRVHFVGFQKDAEPWMQAMDVYVTASTTETFGLAAVEALHQGLPVLCLQDGGGICEVIGKGSEDNVASFDQLVERLDTYYIRKKNAGTCRNDAFAEQASRYTTEATARRQIKLYNELMKDR